MARRGVTRYVTGTASQLGVELPRAQGGSSGGLLVLLVGAYLLLAFVTGRLGWLTNAISDTFATYRSYSGSSTTPVDGSGSSGAVRPNLPRPRTPVTPGVHA